MKLMFAEFWERIEREWAEAEKRAFYYYGRYGPPCDCGSFTCDECNPDWEDEYFEDEMGDEFYE